MIGSHRLCRIDKKKEPPAGSSLLGAGCQASASAESACLDLARFFKSSAEPDKIGSIRKPLVIADLHCGQLGTSSNENPSRIHPLQSSFVHVQTAVFSSGKSSVRF